MATAPVDPPLRPAPDPDGQSDQGGALDDVYERARRRFNDSVIPQQEVRALALAARRFVSIPGAMWEGPFGDTFDNSIKMEINKVAMGLEKILRDYRDNRIIPDFRPKGPDADQETADTLDGMHRADSYHFKSQQALDNAFEEAASGGFGAYRLTHQLADPYDKDSDHQRVNPGLVIVDADQRVFFDLNSKLYDKSDARFCFVLTAYSRDAFNEQYGEDKATSWPENLRRWSFYDWYRPNIVIIAEYYEVEDRSEKLLIFKHRLTNEEQRWWSSELEPEDIDGLEKTGWVKSEQRRKRRRVHKYTISGAEVLKDNGFIAGDRIPVVPVYGKRWFIDNQERFCGYVQMMMDRQRVYNSIISKLAEMSALAPREKPIFAAEQMPSHLATQWANQEIERHPYALVEPLRNADGTIAAAGPIGKIEPPQLPPVLATILQVCGADLVEDQQDPDQVVANTSAEAMDIAATRVDAKSGLYLDNMRQSVQCGGEIYLAMCSEIYAEPGRTVETMTEDGDDGEAVLQQGQTDPQTGKYSVANDFSRGQYKVIVSISEATATRRDKTVKSCVGIAEMAAQAGNTALANVALLTAVMNQDGEGMDDMQKWARRQLIQEGAVEPNEEEQQQLQQAAQSAPPDPAQQLAAAQAQDLQAGAQLKGALTVKAMADAKKSAAQAEDIGSPDGGPDPLDQAEKVVNIRHKAADAEHIATQTAHLPLQLGIEAENARTKRLQAQRAANDTGGRQMIRRGRDF